MLFQNLTSRPYIPKNNIQMRFSVLNHNDICIKNFRDFYKERGEEKHCSSVVMVVEFRTGADENQ